MTIPKTLMRTSRIFKMLILGCLGFITTGSVYAFHIIGGEITYECMGAPSDNVRDYSFTMKVYRDCSGQGAQFDEQAEIGVYKVENGVYSFVRVLFAAHEPITRVEPPDNPCLIVPDNVCVQQAVYRFNLNELEVIDGSYIIFWRRCCRNQTINNIFSPQDEGATYTVEITALAQQECNTSPTFNSFPPTVICVNEPVTFDHSASDAEGDQLVYEFCAPLQGGGPSGGNGGGDDRSCNGIRPDPLTCPPPFSSVNFIGPNYTAVNPLGGDPKVSINANTGLITGTPEIQGQFVVGVCVKEYRNGVLLSVLRRDFQFNVSICEAAVNAEIFSDTLLGQSNFVINSCGQNTVDFINLSERQDKIVSYEWKFDLGGSIETITTRDATVTFPGLGTYTGKLVINKGLSCSDSADINVNIFPSIEADFSFEYDTCVAGPVVFTDLSTTGSGQMTDWQWDFDDGNSSTRSDPQHLYRIPGNHEVTLRVTDINQCVDMRTRTLPYFPVPPVLIIEPSTFMGCAPSDITFTNLSVPIDSTYDIVWDFGDGGQGFEISPTYTYTDPGLYSVRIDVTSPIGCTTSAEFPNWIEIRPSPGAGFTYTPSKPSNFEPEVSFVDQSVDAVGWQWSFSDGNIAFVRNPTHTFRDTGIKEVQQVVFHQNGCTDTAFAMIDVEPQVRYFLPNAFTPNEDSKNDAYKGVGVLEGIEDFKMSIWSRWGEKVFETDDPTEGWNGRMQNTGEDLPLGVYVCIVRFTGPRNNNFEFQEFATLIR